MLAPEAGLKGLSYAQDLGIPYLNINAALLESVLNWRCSRIVRLQHLSCSPVIDGWCHCFWHSTVPKASRLSAHQVPEHRREGFSRSSGDRRHGADMGCSRRTGIRGWRGAAVRRCRKERRISRWSIARCHRLFHVRYREFHAATGAPDIRFDLVNERPAATGVVRQPRSSSRSKASRWSNEAFAFDVGVRRAQPHSQV